jgi:hypothetical protein
VSNPDSFIDEVTEEVRRDRLYAAFRRYGWIGIVLVALTVGGAAWTEWSKARARSQAQAFGDAVLGALDADDPAARRTALEAVSVSGEQVAMLNLLIASDPTENREATLAALDKVAADASLPQIYRDLATLRRVIVAGTDMPVIDRKAALDPIAAPGRAFRTLALEQMAYLLVEEAKTDEAIAAFRALTQDQEAPEGLRERAGQMIVALGGSVEAPVEGG